MTIKSNHNPISNFIWLGQNPDIWSSVCYLEEGGIEIFEYTSTCSKEEGITTTPFIQLIQNNPPKVSQQGFENKKRLCITIN